MAVRGVVRHFQQWKCIVTSQRTCPNEKNAYCGGFHFGWHLPALCVPTRPPTVLDQLVAASAEGEMVAIRLPPARCAQERPDVGQRRRPRRVVEGRRPTAVGQKTGRTREGRRAVLHR